MEVLASVEKYDLSGNSWECVACLPKTLRCHSAVSYKGKLFVFGGESEGVIVNTAYRLVLYGILILQKCNILYTI